MLSPYTLPFEQCNGDAIYRVGGKCASLGAMIQAGAPVPPGFAITTDAYLNMLGSNHLSECIHVWLERLDPEDVQTEEKYSHTIRKLIEETPMAVEIEDAICASYEALCRTVDVADVPVAVRSSATAEDLPGFSFAGQQDTYLWVMGAAAVVEHVRKCWSSLYTARAISYRHDNGFAHEKVLMAVGVQKMVNAKAAGVAFTLNPINGDRSKIAIDSSWGLGEAVVGGEVTPDNFLIDKVIFEVVNRVIKRAEKFYGRPQDVEWAVDADLLPPHNVVILQSRPETVWSQQERRAVSASHTTGIAGVVNTLITGVKIGQGNEKARDDT
ncbi:MAG: phosphoenolpyruvate synthase [Chloroflexi bacterium]|nr:phosphoenolpyruvate synthase [Chloroflexota bacterium]